MKPVTILGGGLAGLTLALFLRKQDVPCVIYEVRDENFRKGGDIALSPNALRVLDHVGIYGRIRKCGWNYDDVQMITVAGKYLGSHTWGGLRRYHYQCLRINRDVVRQALLSEVRLQGIPMHFGKRCVGLAEDGDTISLAFEDGETIHTEFLIGADGIHSPTRQYLYPGSFSKYSGLLVALGHTQRRLMGASMEGVQLPCMFFGKNGTFSILPNSYDGEEIGYFITTDVPDRGESNWAALEKDKQAISNIFDEITEEPGWPQFVRDLSRTTPLEHFRTWPFAKVPDLEHWVSRSGKMILIGDAAHAIPPSGGQGAASAFEDAETLAYVLARLNLPESTLPDMKQCLQRWETHRMERIGQILDYTTRAGNIRKRSSGLMQMVKEWSIWAMFKYYQYRGGGPAWIYNYRAEDILSVISK
ncbi:FAD binding domain-containing protein [Cladophialophora immunda]|nr:FAD binding domain-containing protein [Cladophialophora immunda]